MTTITEGAKGGCGLLRQNFPHPEGLPHSKHSGLALEPQSFLSCPAQVPSPPSIASVHPKSSGDPLGWSQTAARSPSVPAPGPRLHTWHACVHHHDHYPGPRNQASEASGILESPSFALRGARESQIFSSRELPAGRSGQNQAGCRYWIEGPRGTAGLARG